MLDVRLFGKFEVYLDGRSIPIPSRPTQSLFAYLILSAGITYRREKLAGFLWPDSDEKNARRYLRQTLWRLGKAVGKEYFLADKVTVGFNPGVDYTLDVEILQDGIADQLSTDQLVNSVAVYQDTLLPGFYDSWVLLEQERLQGVYERRMQLLLDRLVRKKRWDEARRWAESWIAKGSVPEAAFRALMWSHAGLGDQAGVQSVYQRCVEMLQNEVGVAPSAETQALFQRISSGEDLPEIQASEKKERITIRLPAQPTPFIGRENDLSELGALLSDPTIRLINIQGFGGIGKTRLAIETARTQQETFSDGVFFVPLAALNDPNLIETSISTAVQSSFQRHSQHKKNLQNKQLLPYLRDKKMLLILDNLEHLLKGISIISDILGISRGIKILTTSRQRLNLRGETVYTLNSMFVPEKTGSTDPLQVQTNDAVRLFVSSAKLAQPSFEIALENIHAVIEICRLVDGLPLGIELAGAWAGLLAPDEIAAEIKTSLDFLSTELQDMPDRQKSVRSVFESSWKRLTAKEQIVFQQLSVFRGGFTRQAAESLAGAHLQILMGLVNKSLIKPDYTGRYHLHELLRQYGLEKLREAGKMDQTRSNHLAFFLNLAEEAEPMLSGADQINWANRLELEHDNFRAALDWSRKADENLSMGLRLAGSLAIYWLLRSHYHEGRSYLLGLLSKTETAERTAVRAKALFAAGNLAHYQSIYPESRPLLEESLAIYRKLDTPNQRNVANILINLGDMEIELGDYSKAESLLMEALNIMEDLKDDYDIAHVLWQLGACAVRPGNYEAATQYYEKALLLLRKTGERRHLAIALTGLAEVKIRQEEYEAAKALESESLGLRRKMNNLSGIAISLGNFAWIALRQDDLNQARDFLVRSMTLRYEIGDLGGFAWCLEKMGEIAWIVGQQNSKQQKEAYFRDAARFLGAAQALRAPLNSTIDLVDRPHSERQITDLQALLGDELFTASWAEGQAMTLEQAIANSTSMDTGTPTIIK